MAELISITNRCHAKAKADQRSEKTDHHSLPEKNPDDLGYVRAKRFHNPDFAPFLHRDGNKCAHNAKGGDDNDEKKKEKHHCSLQPDRLEILSIHLNPRLSELRNG